MKQATQKTGRTHKCNTCRGEGKIQTKPIRSAKVECLDCDTEGNTAILCKACHGTGKFVTKRTKNTVDCRQCNGSGTVVVKCRCKGTKIDTIQLPAEYATCRKCGGTGHEYYFNPVISAESVEALLQLKSVL